MKKKYILFIVIIAILILFSFLIFNKKEDDSIMKLKTSYRIESNNINDFDLVFFMLENNKKNKVYSPLSIKYALSMLRDGSKGETYDQINSVLGDYKSSKYNNNDNMSLANAMFIRNTYKDNIKSEYINKLKENYDADIIYDDFNNADRINNWVSDKTFKLINKLFDNVSDKDYILVNALAIDMEWVNKIQSDSEDYIVEFPHENYSMNISSLMDNGYNPLEFNNLDYKVESVSFGAVANRYDIVNDLGENYIKKVAYEKYQEWIDSGIPGACYVGDLVDAKTYSEEFLKDIKRGYNSLSASTDFKYYVDDNVKIFSKELKKYGNATLEFISVMPTNVELNRYINNIDINDLSRRINNLKDIDINNFNDEVITEIVGYIPIFKFDYDLKLKEDLIKLGISDVFSLNKADLSNITNSSSVINEAKHKAYIELSNNGIKAGAATGFAAMGMSYKCGFDYKFDVPIETIDLSFDKPFLFIIRDKYSGEVWFTGTVYEPNKYK